jgi:hypothetical protein
MTKIQRLMKLHRLCKPAGDEGSDTGGTGTADAAKAAEEGAKGEGEQGEPSKAADEGGQKPSDAEAKLLKDLMKHKTRAQAAETELAQMKLRVAEFDGLDGAKLRTLLAEQEEAETKKLEAKGEYDRLVKQMGERHTAEKGTLAQQLAEGKTREQTLLQQIADMTVGSAFRTSAVVAKTTLSADKARVIYGSHFEFKDGAVVAYDKPVGASERTLLVNAGGDPLGFDEAVEQLVNADPDRDTLWRNPAKKGAGSSTIPAKGAREQIEKAAPSNLSSTDKIAAGLRKLAQGK